MYAFEVFFDERSFEKGVNLFKNGKVVHVDHYREGHIVATCQSASSRAAYHVSIHKTPSAIFSHCSCPVTHFCKHAVAVLCQDAEKLIKQGARQPAAGQLTHETNRWLSDLNESVLQIKNSREPSKQKGNFCVLYEIKLDLKQIGKPIEIYPKSVRLLKRGGYGASKNLSVSDAQHRSGMEAIDHEIVSKLKYHASIDRFYYGDSIKMNFDGASDLFEKILRTGRAYIDDHEKIMIQLGDKKPLQAEWKINSTGMQIFYPTIGGEFLPIFILDECWYGHPENDVFGRVESSIPLAILKTLLVSPEINWGEEAKVTEKIKSLLPDMPSLFPKPMSKPVLLKKIKPIPIATLDLVKIEDSLMPVCKIDFVYKNIIVPLSTNVSETVLSSYTEDRLEKIYRDFDAEKAHVKFIKELIKLSPFPLEEKDDSICFLINKLQVEMGLDLLCENDIPMLESNGWIVKLNHPGFYRLIPDNEVEWYSSVEESSYDYFDLEMGVIVNGKKISIYPLVAKVLKRFHPREIDEMPDDHVFRVAVEQQYSLQMPLSRIRPIIHVIIQVHSSGSDVSELEMIRLSNRQASLLHEIEQALQSARHKWWGGDKLRNLGKQLATFQGIIHVPVPGEFLASLRPYQQVGVNWLQFLREYELGGVLADDMGLGKTIQTLAHLTIEKMSGRMQSPCLIVAPTTLMGNWASEVSRFAPYLRTAIFQGDSRHSLKDDFLTYDLIFTTYPLLVRDKAYLISHQFYYLILDEAQFIKNSKAKSSQIVQQIQAKHRLCLSGTPLENHLGELWSLFHFLMPGYLGDENQFVRMFKTPIEKNNDLTKKQMLAARVKPFVLRRTKSEVVQDLPDKTEIVQRLEVDSEQRDLYESVRISMHEKIRKTLDDKGISKSQIVILDALLKLRQICCDPRLLKLDAAKHAYGHSAKLDFLKENLPEMVEEGRKIIIFSQFTSMLKLIGSLLENLGIDYVTLTGSTKNRLKPIHAFQEGSTPIFLISLKAGGTGLNLTSADTVIHFDPWWNPAVEDQATDRAYRIGQKNKVFVYKLIVEGSIEETMLTMQHNKRNLVQGILSTDEVKGGGISSDDIQMLFKPL